MKQEKERSEDTHKEAMTESSLHSPLITGDAGQLGHVMLCCYHALETASSRELHFFSIEYQGFRKGLLYLEFHAAGQP